MFKIVTGWKHVIIELYSQRILLVKCLSKKLQREKKHRKALECCIKIVKSCECCAEEHQ